MGDVREIAVITVLYGSRNWIPRAVGDNILNIVVDNTPRRDLRNEFLGQCALQYIPLGENRGIAYAQNVGISVASEAGCRYIIFFDQDSEVDDKIVHELQYRFKALQESGVCVGAVGPAVYDNVTGKRYKTRVTDDVREGETPMLISSGMFTSVDVLKKVGMMESGLFIDLVDSEWSMRCTSYGYRMYMINTCHLLHKVGESSSKFMGFPIIVSAPFRYYYKYRNTMIMLRRSYVPADWKIKTVIRNAVTLLLVPFASVFKKKRMEILGNMVRGIRDGFKYKDVKNEEWQ